MFINQTLHKHLQSEGIQNDENEWISYNVEFIQDTTQKGGPQCTHDQHARTIERRAQPLLWETITIYHPMRSCKNLISEWDKIEWSFFVGIAVSIWSSQCQEETFPKSQIMSFYYFSCQRYRDGFGRLPGQSECTVNMNPKPS